MKAVCEIKIFEPKNRPKMSKDAPEFSEDVCIIDEDGVNGLAYFSYENEQWMFHTDTLVDYSETGNETKWWWYYPPIEIADKNPVFKISEIENSDDRIEKEIAKRMLKYYESWDERRSGFKLGFKEGYDFGKPEISLTERIIDLNLQGISVQFVPINLQDSANVKIILETLSGDKRLRSEISTSLVELNTVRMTKDELIGFNLLTALKGLKEAQNNL